MFYIAAIIYIFCCLFYLIFASGKRQAWDNPENDHIKRKKVNFENGITLEPAAIIDMAEKEKSHHNNSNGASKPYVDTT